MNNLLLRSKVRFVSANLILGCMVLGISCKQHYSEKEFLTPTYVVSPILTVNNSINFGDYVYQISISESGDVLSVKAINGNPNIDTACSAALRAWKFPPASKRLINIQIQILCSPDNFDIPNKLDRILVHKFEFISPNILILRITDVSDPIIMHGATHTAP